MISKKDIRALSELARINIKKEEEQRLTRDIESILDFVSQIQEVKTNVKVGVDDQGVIKNTMREDSEPHRSGQYTEDILDEAPHKKVGYFQVKKIIL